MESEEEAAEDNFDEKFPLSENLRMFAFDINFRTALVMLLEMEHLECKLSPK